MLDWRNGDEDSAPLDLLQDAPAQQQSRRPWRFFLGLLLLLLLSGALFVRWRMQEQVVAMHEDLTEFVRYEEQQRLFGLRENGKQLVGRRVPTNWYAAYLGTFQAPEAARPVTVEVEGIEFGDAGAVVTVRVGDRRQVRFYRHSGEQWRRVPLPQEVWGERRTVEVTGRRLQIDYRTRDETFVRRLLTDLPSLFASWPELAAIKTIVIEPREFGRPLLERDEGALYLNSPLLAASPAVVDGASVVRLTLATALLDTLAATQESVLPSAERFAQVARLVVATRWALPTEQQMRLREIWRASLADDAWPSLFLASRPSEPVSLWRPDPQAAAALLTVDYLAARAGTEHLGQNLEKLPTVASWDALFVPLLDQYTYEIEQAAEAYAREGMAAARAWSRRTRVRPRPVTPLAVRQLVRRGLTRPASRPNWLTNRAR